MTRHLRRHAPRLCAGLVSAATAIAIGGCGEGSGHEAPRPATSAADPALSQCEGGRPTTVADPAGDVVTKPVRGKPPPATSRPRGSRPWIDIRAASVEIRRGLLCVRLRTGADLPRSARGSWSFTFKLANRSRRARPIPPAGLGIFATGIQWFGPGAVQAEETPLRHAYVREGDLIRVAVRVGAGHPAGIAARGQGLSFTSFQWRLQSSDAGDDPAGPFFFDVDCAPERTWVAYPGGDRVGDPPYAEENIARCR